VLDALRAADETGIEHVGILCLAHQFLGLLHQPLEGGAFFPFSLAAEHFEDFVEASDLTFGFFQVLFESSLQLSDWAFWAIFGSALMMAFSAK
jgi:hypothetical protein